MMREIKFRAWDEQTGRMWNVMSLTRPEQTNLTLVREALDGDTEALLTTSLYFLQFTGLKDKNGKEIYSGDIMEYHSYMVPRGTDTRKLSVVKWIKPRAGFEGCFNGGKVIGNIYENPELTEVISA
jgi:uncharacterized phage protein (TIGR01671 family)